MNTIDWKHMLREALVAGTAGGLLSAGALAWRGQRENGHAAAPINAASHWLWDEDALRADQPSWRYTGLGLATQHAASVFWAAVYAGLREALRPGRPPALAGAAGATALAAVVDYTITPKRLTPGYEHRLSLPGMVATYAALALGIWIGARAMNR